MLHATLHTEACHTRVEHANDIHVLIKCERENVRIGLKNAKMKSPSRPHGFALWICLVDLPCASNLPSLPTCPPCPMYPSCAQSVPALNVSRLLRADGQEFAADAGHDTHSDESCPDRHADARHTGAGESRSRTDTRTQRHADKRHADADTSPGAATGADSDGHSHGHRTPQTQPRARPHHSHRQAVPRTTGHTTTTCTHTEGRTWPGATQASDVSSTSLRKSPDTRHAAATTTAVTHSAPLHPLRRRRSRC